MADRRTWTVEQDQVLKHLRGTLNIKKWSEISKILESQHHIFGRNGKQCRQRYNNHLLENLNFSELTSEEEEKLFKLHNKIGNKWSHISKEFRDRTDNQIKNHFHSKLRKGVRKLNKEIKLYCKNTTKQSYKLNIVYKIVEASDLRFSPKICFDEENLLFFNDLKNSLLQYAGGRVQFKGEISLLNKKQQALALILKVEAFQNLMKCNRWSICKQRSINKESKQKMSKQLTQSSETQNFQGSQASIEEEMMDQAEDLDQIYEEATLQISNELKKTVTNLQQFESSVTRDSIDSVQNEIKDYQQNEKKETYGEKQQILYQEKIDIKKREVIDSLIQEQEFQLETFGNRGAFCEFESLKEFEDSYLNDSEISWVMRKFDSRSEMDARLFE